MSTLEFFDESGGAPAGLHTRVSTTNPLPVNTQSALVAGTDRSGTANTSSSNLAVANANRRGLELQNVGANNLGVNEFGGTAVIGGAGTYTLVPGASMRIRTNRLVTVIAATGATAYTATEW